MTPQPDLRIVDPEATEAAEARIFARSITAPPGLPWDQFRAADLEARMGAPLPLAGVSYQVKRLEGWAPGRPARFAVFYVRADEIGERLSTTREVDGQMVEVSFVSARERRRQAKGVTAIGGAAAGMLAVAALSAIVALQVRAQAMSRLDSIEQGAHEKLRQAQKLAVLKQQTRTLDAAHARGRDLGQVMDDLALVSTAKAPDAHIQAFHWDRGYMAVEVRGEGEPFGQMDRQVQRTDRPLRPGVWLWGIGAAAAPGNRDRDGEAAR